MSDLENRDDETDETYIPPELENESDCDEVSNESYSCRRIDQNKDNKKGNNEISNTEKLSVSQYVDKSNDSSTDDSVAEKISRPKIKKKHPDKSKGERRNHLLLTQSFVGINLAILQSIFMKCVQLIFQVILD